jgi:hypothetical protein
MCVCFQKVYSEMKKGLFVITSIFCLCIGEIYGQVFKAGPKGGIQYSNTIFADKEFASNYTSSLVPGFNIGGAMEYPIYKIYSFQMEVNYSQKGRRLDYFQGPFIKNFSTFHFIEVPMMLRINMDRGIGKYYFNIGPNIGYWLGGSGKLMARRPIDLGFGEQKYSMRFGEETGSYDQLIISEANRVQLGLDAGVGMMLPIDKKKQLMLELRYSMGHTYFAGKESGSHGTRDLNENFEAFSRVISLNAAYMYNIDLWKKTRKGKSTLKVSRKKKR